MPEDINVGSVPTTETPAPETPTAPEGTEEGAGSPTEGSSDAA